MTQVDKPSLNKYENLNRSIELADKIIELADVASEECHDDGCLVVYGIMRDCGYKIRASAECELKRCRGAGAGAGF